MFKGITPVLAVVLLVAIAVGLVTTVYHGISSLTEEAQTGTGSTIEQQFDVMGADLKVDVFGNCKIYLRNRGTKDVPINVISFYADNKPVNTSPTTGTLKKDAVQEITFLNLAPKKYKLLVKIYGKTMDYGYMTCTGPSAVCGNGVVEGTEECDSGNLNGQTCVSLGFTGGTLSCTDGCTFNTSNCTAPVAFSCAIRTSCGGGETEILGLSAKDNAQAEIIGGGGNYPQKLCCSDISSVTTTTGKGTCGAGFTGLITLAGDTNAHVEEYNLSVGTPNFDYKKNICVQLTSGSLSCFYTTYATCESLSKDIIFSMSDNTNAHIGNETAYPDLVLCCKES